VCERCQRDLTDEVHHIVPVSQAPELVFDRTNVIGLCRRCHYGVHHLGESVSEPPPAPAIPKPDELDELAEGRLRASQLIG